MRAADTSEVPRNRGGRPRKWATEAERKHATANVWPSTSPSRAASAGNYARLSGSTLRWASAPVNWKQNWLEPTLRSGDANVGWPSWRTPSNASKPSSTTGGPGPRHSPTPSRTSVVQVRQPSPPVSLRRHREPTRSHPIEPGRSRPNDADESDGIGGAPLARSSSDHPPRIGGVGGLMPRSVAFVLASLAVVLVLLYGVAELSQSQTAAGVNCGSPLVEGSRPTITRDVRSGARPTVVEQICSSRVGRARRRGWVSVVLAGGLAAGGAVLVARRRAPANLVRGSVGSP